MFGHAGTVYAYRDDEEDDEREIEFCLEYWWSPEIQAVVCGPIEACHPAEGGVQPDRLFRAGVEVDMDRYEDVLDELVVRACEEERAWE